MKSLLLLGALLFTITAQANGDCRLYLTTSEVDGRHDLTNKILDRAFSDKGYEIIRIEKLTSDLLETGSINVLTIFSDINSSAGARSDISLKRLSLDQASGNLATNDLLELKVNKSASIFNSASERLVKSITAAIPSCDNL